MSELPLAGSPAKTVDHGAKQDWKLLQPPTTTAADAIQKDPRQHPIDPQTIQNK